MINKAAIVSAFFEPADVLPRLRYAMVLHSPKDGYCGHKKKFGFAPSRVFQGHSEGIIAMCISPATAMYANDRDCRCATGSD